jgi:GNAT superfamily N-acetyltransferase
MTLSGEGQPVEVGSSLERRYATAGDVYALRALFAELGPELSETIKSDTIVVEERGRVAAGYRVERARTWIHVPLLAVSVNKRRNGIAKAILRELIDEAIREDLPLSIEAPPSEAYSRLCQSLGFMPVPPRTPGRVRFVFSV